MDRDRFFKFAFGFTFFLAAGVFFSNAQRRRPPAPAKTVSPQTGEKQTGAYSIVDLERVKTLIKEERLSDREALFYEEADKRSTVHSP